MTCAPATTAPDGSVTRPPMLAYSSDCCAAATDVDARTTNANAIVRKGTPPVETTRIRDGGVLGARWRKIGRGDLEDGRSGRVDERRVGERQDVRLDRRRHEAREVEQRRERRQPVVGCADDADLRPGRGLMMHGADRIRSVDT